MNRSKRIFYFDVLRALAIIGIVFCHSSIAFVISGINNPDFCVSAFFDCFRDFSIPVFVMLSGALLINRQDSLKAFFKKRLSRIFVPFLFWALIYIAYSSVHITGGFDLATSIDIFFGTSSTLGVAFWFVWMIAIAYICIFIINRFICRFEEYKDRIITILALVSVLYIIIVDFGFYNPYPEKITYFLSFMSYIIIGYFLANSYCLESRVKPQKLAIITSLVFICTYLYYIFCFVVPRSQAHGQFVTVGYFNLTILLMSSSFFLTFKYLSRTDLMDRIESSYLGKSLSCISDYSYGIYLSHYMILDFLKTNLFKFTDYTQQSPLIWIPLFVALTLLVSLIILTAMNRISWLKRFSGTS